MLVRGAGVLAVAALGAWGVGSSPVHRPTLAENEAAARADARMLLSRVRLPGDAMRLAVPAGKPAPVVLSSAGVTDESRWAIPADTPAQVMAYVDGHRPAGSHAAGSGYTSGPGTGQARNVTFAFAERPGVLDAREVVVSARDRAGGGSDVTVEADSVWVIPRTPGSMISTATRAITVQVTDAAHAVLSSHTVTGPARVRATVRYFNGLEAGQPFFLGCPVQPPGGVDRLTVSFRRAGAAPLAEASWQEVTSGESGECSAVDLRVRGRDAGTVYGGDYLRSLRRLLGIPIPG